MIFSLCCSVSIYGHGRRLRIHPAPMSMTSQPPALCSVDSRSQASQRQAGSNHNSATCCLQMAFSQDTDQRPQRQDQLVLTSCTFVSLAATILIRSLEPIVANGNQEM